MDNNDRLDRGEQAFAAGDFRAAIIDAKDVLRDEPDNVRARLLLGRSSVEEGDAAAAEKELRRAMELGTEIENIASELGQALILQGKFDEVLNEIPLDGLPSPDVQAKVRTLHGDAEMGLDRPQSARELYTAALDLESENLDALIGVVSSFIAENNFTQARGGLDQLLETHSDVPRVWLYSGSFHARSGDFNSAVANLTVALDLATAQSDDSARFQAHVGLAESLLEQDKVDAAREHIDVLAVEAAQLMQSKLLIARLAFVDKDWAVAQQYLQQVLQVAPGYAPAKMMLGAVQLQSGNLSQAEMYLTSAVASMPNSVWGRNMLAETRLQLQQTEAAQQALAPIVDSPDADPGSLLMAARASFGSEKIDEGLEYLRRSVDSDPDNSELRFQLAVTLLQLGRTDEAQAELAKIDISDSVETAFRRDGLGVLAMVRDGDTESALEAARQVASDYSDRPGAFNLLGAIEISAGDKANAAKSFEKALEVDPQDMVARRTLAEIDLSNGDFDSAIERYNAILVDKPDAAWAMVASGNIAASQGDYVQAAEYFRLATEADADNVDYRLALARTEARLDRKDAAIGILAEDMEMTLGHIPSGVTLGLLKADNGDVKGALEVASELQLRHPENAAGFALAGEAHLIDEDLARADRAYDKAVATGNLKSHVLQSHRIKRQLGAEGAERPLIDFLQVNPLDVEVRSLLAQSYMQTDNLGKSIESYERLASIDPTNAVALNNLAWSYFLADDPRALETARKAHAAMPENGAIVDTLGWIMVQRGSVDEGEKLLRRAVDLENGRPEIRYHHAAALAKLGKVDQARSILDEILSDDADFASREDAESLRTGL